MTERFTYKWEQLVDANPLLEKEELKRLKKLKEDLTTQKEDEETKEILENFEKKWELIVELEWAFWQYLSLMDGDPKIATNEKDAEWKEKIIDIFKDLYLPITKELNWEPKRLSDMMSHFEGNIENHATYFLSEINKNKPAI